MIDLMLDYRVEIVSTTAVVDERNGSATVDLHLFLTGMLDGIPREGVDGLLWSRGNVNSLPSPPFEYSWSSTRLFYRSLSYWHAERTPPYLEHPGMRKMLLHCCTEHQRLHTSGEKQLRLSLKQR